MMLLEERSPIARPTAQPGFAAGFRLSAWFLVVFRPLLLVCLVDAALLARSWRAWPLAVGMYARMNPRDSIASHCRCL